MPRRPSRAWIWVYLLALVAGFNHLRRPFTADDRDALVPRICFCDQGDPEVGPELRVPPPLDLERVLKLSVRAVTHHWNEAAIASYLHHQSPPADLTIVEEIRERRRRRA